MSAPAPQPAKLNGLDHLRALAIIQVFVFHYGRLFPHPEWTNAISRFGWTGVDLFFVLSGYLITSQLFAGIASGNGIAVKEFYIKRFLRIIPAYLFVVLLYFVFPVTHEREGLAPLWRYLTFTQNYGLDLSRHGTFSHAWSLCIEEQFYFFLPLVLMGLLWLGIFRKVYWLLPLAVIAGIVVRALSYQHYVQPFINHDDNWALYWYKWLYYPTHCRLDGLLAGISLAVIFRFCPALTSRLYKRHTLLLLSGVAVLAGAYFICLDQESYMATVAGFPLVSLGYGLVVAAALCPAGFLYRYSSSVTSRLAAWSYAAYLVHKIIIHLTQLVCSSNALPEDGNLMFLLSIIATLVATFIINKTIEQPLLRLRTYLLRDRDKT